MSSPPTLFGSSSLDAFLEFPSPSFTHPASIKTYFGNSFVDFSVPSLGHPFFLNDKGGEMNSFYLACLK